MAIVPSQFQSARNSESFLEREAERRYRDILEKFKIGHVMQNPDNVRSLASHWGNWRIHCDEKTFLLYRLPEMDAAFGSYLDDKGKPFSVSDREPFIAWKFWEAKIRHQNIYCPEMYTQAFIWTVKKENVIDIYEAFGRTCKQRDKLIDDLIQQICSNPAAQETVKELKQSYYEERREMLDVIADRISKGLFDFFGSGGATQYLPQSNSQIESHQENQEEDAE